MNTVSKIESWADTHHPKWIDFIRIALGLFILYKGILFISNVDVLMQMTQSAEIAFFNMALAHYVAFAHLVGGLLIAIGLLTRIAVIVQIPILIGAVFFVNIQDGFMTTINNMEFTISLVVLVMLLVILFYGSGKFSVDHWMKQHPNE